MAQLVRVLDERKWALRCFYADILALLLVIVLAITIIVDSHYVGFYTFNAAESLEALKARDAAFFRLVVESVVFSLALAWLAYRVVLSGYKSITRNV